jgi:hypothetical protein
MGYDPHPDDGPSATDSSEGSDTVPGGNWPPSTYSPPQYAPPTYVPPSYTPPGGASPTYSPPDPAATGPMTPPGYQPSPAPPYGGPAAPAQPYGNPPGQQPSPAPAPPYAGAAYPQPASGAYGGYPPPPPGYVGAPGYGSYPGSYGYPGATAPRTDGTAIAALVLAIVSFLLCPLIPAVVALALIPASRRNIAASGGAVEGASLLTAAKWIAWINVGIAGIFVILILVGVIADVTSSSSNSLAHLVLG